MRCPLVEAYVYIGASSTAAAYVNLPVICKCHFMTRSIKGIQNLISLAIAGDWWCTGGRTSRFAPCECKSCEFFTSPRTASCCWASVAGPSGIAPRRRPGRTESHGAAGVMVQWPSDAPVRVQTCRSSAGFIFMSQDRSSTALQLGSRPVDGDVVPEMRGDARRLRIGWEC